MKMPFYKNKLKMQEVDKKAVKRCDGNRKSA